MQYDEMKINYLQAALNEAISYYGLESGAIVRDFSSGGFTAEIRASIEIPRSLVDMDSQKALQGVLRILEYRVGTSGYVQELAATKDLQIKELNTKVDKLERMLENALELRTLGGLS